MSNPRDNLQLQGKVRDEALEQFSTQLAKWGVKMPPVEPLVLDFGKGEFYRIGLIEYWIANEIGAGYCAKYLFLFDGQQCPCHGHKQKHETFFVVHGKVRMIVDGEKQTMTEGDVLAMPAGKEHSFTGIGNALVLEVSTPCLVSDNQFQDPATVDWLMSNLQK